MTTAADFYLKRGDLLPQIKSKLKNPDGSAMNLAGATVRFRMRAAGEGSPKVDAAATVVDAPTGTVAYAWQGTDSDTEGLFNAEWPVTIAGAVETVPNNGFLKVLIGPHL